MSSAMRADSVVIRCPGAGAPEDARARRRRRARAPACSGAHVTPPSGRCIIARGHRTVTRHAVPRVPHRILDLFPGGPVVTAVLVTVPAGLQVGFGLVEGAAGVVPGRLE